jgi:hypothetical protein
MPNSVDGKALEAGNDDPAGTREAVPVAVDEGVEGGLWLDVGGVVEQPTNSTRPRTAIARTDIGS